MVKNEILVKELKKQELKEKLEKNNILVKEDGSFTLGKEEKEKLEKNINYSFSKKRFTDKNVFLYNMVKEKLEELGYTLYTDEELENKVKEELKKLEKEEVKA